MKKYLSYVKKNLLDPKFLSFIVVWSGLTVWQGYTQENDGDNFKIMLIVSGIITAFFLLGSYMNMKESES